MDPTDDSSDSSSFLDVITGAASDASSSVISGLGDRISSAISGGSGAAPNGAPVSAKNKPQPGVVAAGGVSVSLLAAAAGAYFFLKH